MKLPRWSGPAMCALAALALGASSLGVSQVFAAGPAAGEVVVAQRPTLPTGPEDAAWKNASTFVVPLIVQDMVEPRLLTASTTEVAVQAASDGQRVAFRLEWKDTTNDDLPGNARFSDACAVQLPARTEPNVPAPQMGEPDRPVEIVFWKAFWQATVDGRPDTVQAIHPGATVDHYPAEAASLEPGSAAARDMARRYAPARSLGNEMAGPRTQPVEELLATGPGTLSPAPKQEATGDGKRTADGWTVVIERPLPKGLVPGGRSQVAFAVWDGANDEVGARKMRSAWIPLAMEGGR